MYNNTSQIEQSKVLPPLPEFAEAIVKLQETWLMLVEACHKPDRQETIAGLLAAANDIMKQTKSSTKLVEDTKVMLTNLMEMCYDSSMEKTLENMRAGFEQVNSRLPSTYKEKLG